MSEIRKKCTFWNFGAVKTLMQGIQIDNFSIEKFSATKKFSMPTLMEKIEPVVLVKQEFKDREKLKLKGFLWNFQSIRIMMQDRENNHLFFGYSPIRAVV